MTFKKSGFVVTAFQIVGDFLMAGKPQRARSWIVIGWAEGHRMVFSDRSFEATFGARPAREGRR